MSKEQIKNGRALGITLLPLRDRISLISKAVEKAANKRKEQGFPMTHRKKQMYELGFEDAIDWILESE